MPSVEVRKLCLCHIIMGKIYFRASVYNMMGMEGWLNDRALNPSPSRYFSYLAIFCLKRSRSNE